MFTPAATAARTASEPEWWNVPSPRFCTRWRSSVKGAMPIHCAPSPPICVIPVISPLPSGLSRTIVWQPMPAPTSVPSGALSDELCGHPRGDRAGHHVGVQVELGRQQPLAAVVALADDAGRVCGAVEHLLELRLEERALLLDDEDLVEPVGELADDLRLQRPDHAELQQPDGGQPLEAETAQGVHEIAVGLAGRDDAEPRVASAVDSVEAVLARVREREVGAHAVQRSLQLERSGR